MFFRLKIADYLVIFLTVTVGFFSGHWITGQSREDSTPAETKNINRRAPEFSYRNSKEKLNLTKILESGERGRELSRIVNRLLNGEAPQNWEKELSKLLEHSRGQEGRREALLVFFSKWAEADFQSAFERAGQIPLYVYHIRNEIFSQLSEKDPKVAFTFYEKNAESSLVYASTVLGDIAKNWAKLNPEEAFEWCNSSVKKYKVQSLIHFMHGLDWEPVKTRAYMDKIQARSGKIHRILIEEWIKADPDTATEWIKINGND